MTFVKLTRKPIGNAQNIGECHTIRLLVWWSFLGCWFWFFSPDGRNYVSPPLIMETFRIKILTYKAFCYYNMRAFLRKELSPEAVLAKPMILMTWQHFLGTGFSNFSAGSWMSLSWGILIRIGNTMSCLKDKTGGRCSNIYSVLDL